MVIVSGRLDLPWEAPLFTSGGGEVLVLTANAEAEAPATATPVRVVRHEGGVDLAAALLAAAAGAGNPRAALRGRPPSPRPSCRRPGWSTISS